MLINNFIVIVIVWLPPISKDLWGGTRTTQRNVFHHDFSNVLQTYFKNMKAGVCLAFCIIRGERYGRNCVSRIGTGHCWQSAAAKWWKIPPPYVVFMIPCGKKIVPKPVFNLFPLHLRSDSREKSKRYPNWEKLGGQFLNKENKGNQFCRRKKIGKSVS